MKKLGIICLMALFAIAGMVSCQSSANADKEIQNKIEHDGELTQEDYTHMIKYVGEFAEQAQKYVTQNGASSTEEIDQLKKEYPYLDMFRDEIASGALKDFSKENLELIGKYAGLTEFTAPAGFNLQTDPNAAGIEVAAPDSANGVIAGGVDTVKVKK